MIIDLSLPIKNNTSEPDSPRITYLDHRQGARNLIDGAVRLLSRKNPAGGLLLRGLLAFSAALRGMKLDKKIRFRSPLPAVEDFPGGMGLANEEVHLDTHAGTHLDAPWHFGPAAGGGPARRIDEIPLEWCYGDGVVLDLRHKKAGELILAADIEEALRRIPYTLKPFDIVLLMTGADRHFDTAGYFSAHPGMSAEATEWLIERGVKVMGIDAWGFDRPAMGMLGDYLKTRDSACLFPAHFTGRKKEYCHMEKLAHLDKIPRPAGFKVACFPVKIENAGAGWCRVVAIL